jgi:hypothetical protein
VPYDPTVDTVDGAITLNVPASEVDQQGWPNAPLLGAAEDDQH